MTVDTLLRKEKDGSLGAHNVGAFQNGRIPSRDDELPENALHRSPNGFQPSAQVKFAFALPPPAQLREAGQAALAKGKGLVNKGLELTHKYEDPIEVGGLAYLAAPNVDNMQAGLRARRAGLGDPDGHVPDHDMDRFRLIKEKNHDIVEATGLGSLAAPLVAKRLRTGSWTGH
jgi:hypothetical protein